MYTKNLLSKISRSKRSAVLDIFDFWNSYKGEKGWHSHNKLTPDMIEVILENLKKYPYEEICIAIENYATVLINDEYLWSYTWPLTTFLTVKTEKRKDALKKWIKYFHPENFNEQMWLKQVREDTKVDFEVDHDEDPELTQKIVDSFKNLIHSPDYELSNRRKRQFISTTKKMIIFFSRSNGRIPKSAWVDYLMECVWGEYIKKGIILHAGHLCSTTTWDTLMPQHLKDLGVWYEKV